MPYIRKHTAGADSFGHTWEHDGDVVEMPHEEAEQLLVIPDGGFTLADGPADAQADADDSGDSANDGDDGEPSEPSGDEDDQEVTEPAPAEEQAVTEQPAAKPATRRGRKPATGSED